MRLGLRQHREESVDVCSCGSISKISLFITKGGARCAAYSQRLPFVATFDCTLHTATYHKHSTPRNDGMCGHIPQVSVEGRRWRN